MSVICTLKQPSVETKYYHRFVTCPYNKEAMSVTLVFTVVITVAIVTHDTVSIFRVEK